MTFDDLKVFSDAKWKTFYQSVTAFGVWIISLTVSLAYLKWTDGSALAIGLCFLSCVIAVVMGMQTLAAMIDAYSTHSKFRAAKAIVEA